MEDGNKLPLRNDNNNDGNKGIVTKQDGYMKVSYTPIVDPEMKINMEDPHIWKGFPIADRFWYYFLCKSSLVSENKQRNGKYNVEDIITNPCNLDKGININGKILTMKILKSGTLDIEPAIVHPFVRMSIVNLKTCRLLQKKNFDVPVFLRGENNILISHNKNRGDSEYRESLLDCIPPFATPPYDLRVKGESFAEWNEEFIINEDAENILQTDNIIFFELLDFNFFVESEDYTFPIAWGYLKPVGYSQTYFGRYKIQLYKYKYKKTDQFKVMESSTYLRTPEVLLEFNWINREKYQTYLEIEIKLENRPTERELSLSYLQRRYRNSAFLAEGEDDFDREILLRQQELKKKKAEEMDANLQKKNKLLLLRSRLPNEDCILPDHLLFKFHTSKLGCLTLQFSNDGKYLAAACTEMNSMTTIKIFNVEEGTHKYHFKGHQQLIHQLTWSEDNSVLISASADNYVSLWHIPHEESNNFENLEYLDNEKVFKIHSIPHPSYVYSCAIFPDQSNKELMILATACFDGNVRIFLVTFQYEGMSKKHTFIKLDLLHQISIFDVKLTKDIKKRMEILDDDVGDTERAHLNDKTVFEHRHPNYITFDETGMLFIGDSLGVIHMYHLRIANGGLECNKERIIQHKEINGDNINKIMFEPRRGRLVIHSRDNCIRLVDYESDKPKIIVRYFGVKCSKNNIRSSVSPDGNFIISGSEIGKPCLYSLLSGIGLPTDKYECEFFDSVADVCWNEVYNMFALSGFGHEYPILVYVHTKHDVVIEKDKNFEKPDKLQPMLGDLLIK
jgi:jouberin